LGYRVAVVVQSLRNSEQFAAPPITPLAAWASPLAEYSLPATILINSLLHL